MEEVGSGSGTPNETVTSSQASIVKNKDIAWEHVDKLGAHHLKCKHCSHEVRGGGITRMKEHLIGKSGDVRTCMGVSESIRIEIRNSMEAKSKTKKVTRQRKIDDFSYIDVDSEQEDDIIEFDSISRGLKKSTNENKKPKKNVQQTLVGCLAGKEAISQAHMEIAKFFYDQCIPFNACKSEFFSSMFAKAIVCGPGFQVPKYHALRKNLLLSTKVEVDGWVESLRGDWSKFGCTIMADGWTSTSQHVLINFLIYCSKGVVFWKSIDASDIVRNAIALADLFEECIQFVGVMNVVQIVTDNGSNFKAAGNLINQKHPHISWTPCAAHCLNLMLKEIGQLPHVANVVKQAANISKFVYNHLFWLAWLRKRPDWTEIVRPGPTRFATAFLSLQSVCRHKHDLQALVTDRDFIVSSLYKEIKTRDFVDTIFDRHFWEQADLIVKVMLPLLRVLRVVDSDASPSIGFVYTDMKKAKQEIKSVLNNDKDQYDIYLEIIKRRWDTQLKRHMHAAAFWLNPRFLFANDPLRDKPDIQEGILEIIESKGGIDKCKMIEEMMTFEGKVGSFGKEIAVKMSAIHHPVHWWSVFGYSASHLQSLAKRVLGQTSSASGCERNWSVFERIHTKKRNRLESQRLNDLVYIHYNIKLRQRWNSKTTLYDPIDWDNDSQIQEWVMEDENDPFLDNEEITTLLYGDVPDPEPTNQSPQNENLETDIEL